MKSYVDRTRVIGVYEAINPELGIEDKPLFMENFEDLVKVVSNAYRGQRSKGGGKGNIGGDEVLVVGGIAVSGDSDDEEGQQTQILNTPATQQPIEGTPQPEPDKKPNPFFIEDTDYVDPDKEEGESGDGKDSDNKDGKGKKDKSDKESDKESDETGEDDGDGKGKSDKGAGDEDETDTDDTEGGEEGDKKKGKGSDDESDKDDDSSSSSKGKKGKGKKGKPGKPGQGGEGEGDGDGEEGEDGDGEGQGQGKSQKQSKPRKPRVGDEVVVHATGDFGIVEAINPDGTYKVKKKTDSDKLAQKLEKAGANTGDYGEDEISVIPKQKQPQQQQGGGQQQKQQPQQQKAPAVSMMSDDELLEYVFSFQPLTKLFFGKPLSENTFKQERDEFAEIENAIFTGISIAVCDTITRRYYNYPERELTVRKFNSAQIIITLETLTNNKCLEVSDDEGNPTDKRRLMLQTNRDLLLDFVRADKLFGRLMPMFFVFKSELFTKEKLLHQLDFALTILVQDSKLVCFEGLQKQELDTDFIIIDKEIESSLEYRIVAFKQEYKSDKTGFKEFSLEKIPVLSVKDGILVGTTSNKDYIMDTQYFIRNIVIMFLVADSDKLRQLRSNYYKFIVEAEVQVVTNSKNALSGIFKNILNSD